MMEQTPIDARYEVKFVCGETSLHKVTNWLQLNPAAFAPSYPGRFVHSAYFDTNDHAAYFANLAGTSKRTKVRYRWYGKERTPTAGVLEIKKRRNCYGWKLGFPVSEAPYTDNDSWRDIRTKIRRQITDVGRAWLDAHPMPVLLNEYYRRYFVSGDGLIRVTVDSSLRTWDQRSKSRPSFTHNGVYRPVAVIEFKFDRQYRDAASLAMLGLSIRVSRNSKYVTGLQSLIL